MEQRIPITSRIVRILTQVAYEKKEQEQLSLTAAKDSIARHHGFRDWQHIKDLAKKQTDKPLTPATCDLYMRSTASISSDQGCNSFNVELLGSTYDDDEEDKPDIVIGRLRGHMWSFGKRSLFDTFDPLSQELADFAEYFEHDFERICEEYVGSLAYIDQIIVDEKYSELDFGKLILKSFFNRIGNLVDAVFTYPMPAIEIQEDKICTLHYDRCKEAIKKHSKIFLDLGFNMASGTNYLYVHNAYRNDLLDNVPSPEGDEDD